MKIRHRPAPVAIAACLLCGILLCCRSALRTTRADQAAEAEAVRSQFAAQIAPILARHCLECHDAATGKGGLDLSRKERALEGGESGRVLAPGKSGESLLWQHVESGEMPQNRPPLSDDEKQRLREWIDAGADWTLDVIDASAVLGDRRIAGNWVQRLTVTEYIDTVRAATGVDIERDARRLLPRDVRADGFSNTAYNLPVDLAHVEAYARLARLIVARMDVPAFVRDHAPSESVTRTLAASGALNLEESEPALREAVSGIGKWLLRGPLQEHEVPIYLGVARAVVDESGSFAEALSFVIEAMLQSPRFLYRIEDQGPGGAPRPVGDYELASRLSYILWGEPPDRELFRAAEAGELADRGHVEAQAARMLEDPRAVRRSLQFIHDWLDLDRLAGLRPGSERFPQWNEQLAADMRRETLAFFEEVVWKQRRPLWDLLNAQVTWATPRLAQHYGLDPDAGERAGVSELASIAGTRSTDLPARVTQGLQALYTFEDVTGGVVRDTSGAGEPLDLTITDFSAVQSSTAGLAISAPTIIATRLPPGRLIDAVERANAFTLEAWITPANTGQSGPARIVTFSVDPSGRNFTLGQEGDRYEVRFRTTATDANGQPALRSPGGAVATRPTHLVFTRDESGRTKLFVDAKERVSGQAAGNLSNWEPQGREDRRKPAGLRLAFGNELTRDRPWLGTLHLVAIYNRVLTSDEVRQNHTARAGGHEGLAAANAGPVGSAGESVAMQALYTFDEGAGETVRDSSGADGPLNLTIEDPSAAEWNSKGLTFKGAGLVATRRPPARLIAALKQANSLTLDTWITPGETEQSGPARIVTLSSGTGERNFTLGQDGSRYDVRHRTTKTNANGHPSLASADNLVQLRPTRVTYTRDAAGQARLYIDGEQVAALDVAGDLSNWGDDYRLAIGNETTRDRPWMGTMHRLALYSRALSPEEVRFGSGPARYDLASVPARGGLLTQGSVLTIGGDEASMVARGLFVLHELLSSRVGNPPPCVDTSPVPTRPGLTQRGAAETRIANSACAGCHSRFEPLAFGLERFDGIGGWSETDHHGNPLREDGEILFPGAERPVAYTTSAELMDLLAGSDRVRLALTRKVTQFALGRPLVEHDRPIVERIHAEARERGGTYAATVTAIVLSDLVRMTGTEGSD